MEMLSNKNAVRYSIKTFLPLEPDEVMDFAIQLGERNYGITDPTLLPRSVVWNPPIAT